MSQPSERPSDSATGPVNPLLVLLDLARRSRQAGSAPELAFMLVNDSHALAAYRQSALWMSDSGIQSLSGVVQIEANAPYAQWLERVCAHLLTLHTVPAAVSAVDLPGELAEQWAQWLPEHGLWLPFAANTSQASNGSRARLPGGLLLARELPWTPQEMTLLAEWIDIWHHSWRGLFRAPVWSWKTWRSWLLGKSRAGGEKSRWRRSPLFWIGLVILLLVFPVRLTVLAPGELVPAHPLVIRAPLDGVLDTFHVEPNQSVKKGQPLFGFDEALIQSRLEVALQTLATAETEYRQTSQQALLDAKFRTQLAMLTGKIEEKRTEVAYLREQLQRSRVLAPQDGVVLFDDPSEWIGRPVSVGERILRLAATTDTEVEVWLALADAVVLEPGANVNLYLNSSPLSPVAARMRYMAHDAVLRPDGGYAYRVRASLVNPTMHRVGLKGTAKLQGGWVPLVYWVLRRPLASVRSTLGY